MTELKLSTAADEVKVPRVDLPQADGNSAEAKAEALKAAEALKVAQEPAATV